MNPLYVVSTYFNPFQSRARQKLYEPFRKHVLDSGAKLLTVEVAIGECPFEVTQPGDRWDLQLATNTTIWHKERALNLGVQRLPDDWRYVAFVDGDITFANPNWVRDCVLRLQHEPVVQMFSKATDLSDRYEPLATHKGFVYSYRTGEIDMRDKPYEGAHPGYCWAMRRDAFDTLGGLFDTAILGSGDRHVACALMSDVDRSYPEGLSPGYVEQLKIYQRRASRLKGNVGYMPGLILHGWHGPKASRGYQSRWQIISRHQYDSEFDLCPSWNGLYQLSDRSPGLRDDIRAYFESRRDDDLYRKGD